MGLGRFFGRRSARDGMHGRTDAPLIGLSVALVLMMITNALMQYSLGVLGPVLIDRFDLSRTRLGLLSSILFVVGSSLSPFAGRLVDRIGARRLLTLPFLSTIGGFALLAFAPSFEVVLIAVMVAGVGMGFANPLTNKLVALHVPLRRQGLILGIKQSGVQAGAAITGLAMPLAVLLLGFTAAALVTVAVIAAWMVYCFLIVPADGVSTRRPAGSGSGDGREVAAADDSPDPAMRRQLLRAIGSYAVLMGSGLAALYAYLPLFAVERLDMSIAEAGLLAGLIGLMGVVSRVVWGALSERIGHPAFVLMLLAGAAVVAQTLLALSPALGPWASWSAVVLIGGSAVAWNSVAMFAIIRELGTQAAGANSGLIQLAFFSGFAIGPVAFGALSDLSGGFGAGMVAIGCCFLGATMVALRWTRQAHAASSDAGR